MDKLTQFKEAMKAKKEAEELMKQHEEQGGTLSLGEKELFQKKISQLEEELNKAQTALAEEEKKAKDAKEQYVRLYAEFDNFRKRAQKDKEDGIRSGHERIVKELLPILDNLEKAIEHGKTSSDQEALLKGVELVLKQFINALEAFGLKPVHSVGQPFDPHHHEAMGHEESDEHEPHTVVQEYRRGYKLHDRLIRPSLVTVAKPPEEKQTKNSQESDSSEEE